MASESAAGSDAVEDPVAKSSTEESRRTEFSFSCSPSLEEIRVLQSRFADERNWEQFHTPRNLLLALVGEVGELSEIFQWRGEVEPGLPGWSEAEREHVGEEMSDILIYLVRMAEMCRVDLPSAVMRKFAKNARKYPTEKAYGSMLKYTAYTDKQ